MGLPTIEKTWIHTEVNQNLSAGTSNALAQLTMYSLKDSLVTLNWEVVASSNATSAGESDYWSSSSDCVWNEVSARSWIVLRNTTIDIELCIELDSNTYAFANLLFSRAGFSGFTSTTARPTATDEYAALTDGFWGHDPGSTQMGLHVLATSDGANGPENTLVFFASDYNNGTQCWMINKISTTHNNAGNPVHIATSDTYSSWQPTMSILYDTSSRQRLFSGDANYASVWCTAQCFGSGDWRITASTGGSPSDLDSGYPADQIGIFCYNLGARGKVGYLKDIWWGRETHLTGDTYPSTANTYAKFGAIIIPWGNETTPYLGT